MARRKRLIGRKRGPDPQRTGRAYMDRLQMERRMLCRKWDRKAFDEFHAALYTRAFPD